MSFCVWSIKGVISMMPPNKETSFPSTTFFAMLSYQRITHVGFDGLHLMPLNIPLTGVYKSSLWSCMKASCLDIPLLSISYFLFVSVIYWNWSIPENEESSILIVREEGKNWRKEEKRKRERELLWETVTNISEKKVLTSVSSYKYN